MSINTCENAHQCHITFACVYEFMHMCVCVEENVITQVSFSISLPPSFHEAASLMWIWSSPIRLGCLVSKLHRSPCLHLLWLGLQTTPLCLAFKWVLGRELSSSCFHHKRFTWLSCVSSLPHHPCVLYPYICLCVCLSVLCVCVRVCTHLCMCVEARWCSVSSFILHLSFWDGGLSANPKFTSWLGWSASSLWETVWLWSPHPTITRLTDSHRHACAGSTQALMLAWQALYLGTLPYHVAFTWLSGLLATGTRNMSDRRPTV